MNMSNDLIIFTEYLVPALIAGFLAVSFAFKRVLSRVFIASAAMLQVAVVTFRPDDYNSDTFNYSRYLQSIADSDGFDVFTASKFEPFHLGLAYLAQDFGGWLLLEGIMCCVLIVGLLRRLESMESTALILGAALPLFSSSTRFSLGVLAIAFAMAYLPRNKLGFVGVSLVGLFTHVSLAVTALLQRKSLLLIVFLVVGFYFYSATDLAVMERAGASEDVVAGGTGLRVFIPLMLLLAVICPMKEGFNPALLKDIVIATVLFAVTFFLYPVFNRFIIVFLIVKAIETDGLRMRKPNGRLKESVAAVVLYGLLVLPHLLSFNKQLAAGDW
jgi:hypothetical protein